MKSVCWRRGGKLRMPWLVHYIYLPQGGPIRQCGHYSPRGEWARISANQYSRLRISSLKIKITVSKGLSRGLVRLLSRFIPDGILLFLYWVARLMRSRNRGRQRLARLARISYSICLRAKQAILLFLLKFSTFYEVPSAFTYGILCVTAAQVASTPPPPSVISE